MDPKLLPYFVRVADLKSINKAAQMLNISQPQLSRHIAALEEEMETELFVRGQRGVTLTTAGMLLLERVRPVLEQISSLKDELGRATSQQVVLGMPASLRELLTGPIVVEFTRAHPHVQLRVYEGLTNAIRGWMQNGLIDAGVVAFDSPRAPPFVQQPLVREPLLLIGDASAGLTASRPIQLPDLAAFRFVLPGKPNRLRQVAESALRRRGLPLRPVVEVESFGLCMDLVRRGLGQTIMPGSALHNGGFAADLSWAPIVGLAVTWSFSVNEERQRYAAVNSLRAALIERVREVVTQGNWPGAELVGTDVEPDGLFS